MPQLIQLFILIPLLGFLISVMLPRNNEKLISQVVISSVGIHLGGIVLFILFWLMNDHPVIDIKHITFFKTADIEIFIDFYFDKVTAVFALIGSVITLLVALFSRYYLHRDDGFKRFFSTTLLFFVAYNVVIFSGNFETLFMGWEVLGICSFLLIAFYRDRYLPVKNGLKIISIYRLGDICLILTMWMSHQLWHENITFFKLNDTASVQGHLLEHNWYGVFICVMLFFAAATKSAQLPFSSWLPRAMEGPTTSSAIFYGSLSVHLGVFLLLRTYPYWESLLFVKVLIIVTGLLTSFIAASIARVQSTVKTLIAYSSITQIGLMFVEVALGCHTLALFHFAANAFLRTYQLLVSPSMALNPAYAGNETYLSGTLMYRDQWNGLPGAPKAQLLSVNLPRLGKRIGLGLNFERQSIGITEKITYELMYAYKFLLGEGTLSMGMNVSGRNYIQDYTDERLFAIQGITMDPAIPQTIQSRNLFNAGFGVYFNTNKFYFGGTIPRMIRADIDFDTNQLFSTEVRHLLLMTGGTFIINNNVRATPQLLFKAAENSPWGLDLNFSLTYKDQYTAGLTYRTGGTRGDLGESIDLIFGVQLSERLMFGFAYDISLSKLRTVSNGSLEAIISYNLIPRKIKTIIVNPRYF